MELRVDGERGFAGQLFDECVEVCGLVDEGGIDREFMTRFARCLVRLV